MLKYDITNKERQKLEIHIDKSEWTFLIALSGGCGWDYDVGGTLHVQQGHALIFPGKFRHKLQMITKAVRFLLSVFKMDKSQSCALQNKSAASVMLSSLSASIRSLRRKNYGNRSLPIIKL